jgi:hypothetical protein
LTVVAHELGHELGLADTTGDGLMGVFLPPGVRRVPTGDPAPGTSSGQGLLQPSAPRPLAPLLGSGGDFGPDVIASLFATRLDPTWTAPGALVAGVSGAIAFPNSSAPVLPPVEKSSGVLPEAVPFGRRAAAALGAVDVVLALDANPLWPEVG